jgi:hypothetical protein
MYQDNDDHFTFWELLPLYAMCALLGVAMLLDW